MAPPNNPNIARITYQMHRGTQVVENTFHLHRSGGWTLAQLQAAVLAAYNLWNTYAKPVIPSGIALFNVHGQVYDPNVSPWTADYTVSPEIAGTATGTTAPGNVTSTLSERANLAGRKYRGRIYWPGIPEGNIASDDTLNSAFIAALAGFALQWILAFPAGGTNGALVIFHRLTNTFDQIATIVIEKILDSQRRRLPGRGN